MPQVFCIHRWKKNNTNDLLVCGICDETWDAQQKTPPEIVIGKIDVPEELYFGTSPRPLPPPKS